MGFYLFILFMLLLFVSVRPVNVLLHELGHALPAILITKEKVTVFIGSYGDTEHCFLLHFSKMDLYLKHNFFNWRKGLTVYHAVNVPPEKNLIFTITGPLASAVVASIALCLAQGLDLHSFLKGLVYMFVFTSVIDLFNLIPNNRPVTIYKGRNVYNDGHQIKTLVGKMRKKQEKAEGNWPENELFKFAEEKLSAAYVSLNPGELEVIQIYREAIAECIKIKDFSKGSEMVRKLESTGKPLSWGDLYNAGYLKYQLARYDEAMSYFQASLAANSHYPPTCNFIGYILLEKEFYTESIKYFDQSINIDATIAYPFNNKGLALLKLGELQNALKNIHISLFLDDKNSYAWRNLGIYHIAMQEPAKAMENLIKAKELDPATPMVDDLLLEAEMMNSGGKETSGV